MESETLGSALEREHREIDGGIEAFTAQLADGTNQTKPLVHAMAALRRHIYLEEQFLFPPLRTGSLFASIVVMLREHGELWNAMDALEALLDNDADADAVLDSCRGLLALLERHNSKEEPIIYSQADEGLTASASAELRAFLDSGQMPDGWVCQRARPAGVQPQRG